MDKLDLDKNNLVLDTIKYGQGNLPRVDIIHIEESPVIKPINQETVHKICSGQVVLNLSIAVKELVENAIDAGATNIEIKLKEYGSELIEVIDNGCGVLEQNFDALTLKHYTSKLKEFTDLESVETLGFRGEALSSLCALSCVTITTRHNTVNVGTKLEYDHNGGIIKRTCTSRPEGTTVTLTNIFTTLPVRRKEFLKNLKREFNKTCQLLYAYCLVSTNIKITLVNQVKNKKTVVMATQGSPTVRENIINVFGAKQISSLIDVSTVEPNEEIFAEYSLKVIPNEEIPFRFEFFISSVMHGSGRSTADRQFYYINSRPCEPTKVTKLVNEVYKQFNGNQYPFVFLNILTDRHHTDINVTPDKRQILLDNEKLLLAVLKASLLDAFKDFPSTYALQNVNMKFTNTKLSNSLSKGLKRVLTGDNELASQPSVFECFNKKPKKNESDVQDVIESTSPIMPTSKTISSNYIGDRNDVLTGDNELASQPTLFECFNKKPKKDESNVEDVIESTSPIMPTSKTISSNYIGDRNDVQNINTSISTDTIVTIKEDNVPNCKFLPSKNDVLTTIEVELRGNDNKSKNQSIITGEEKTNGSNNISSKRTTNILLNTSITLLEQAIKKKLEQSDNGNYDKVSVKFRSKISPNSNDQAEQELQKQITKDKFKQMRIIGQFNLAFIVAQLEDDLFIIDQHASDEKYNFEQLQLNTVLETQALVNPKSLHLTVANENLLIDNEDKFKKNGFVFSIDHTAPPTKKVSLTAMPVSKNYLFGKDDIDELLFILQEGNDNVCRPSRVRQMFASRACRKSVMIGKPLTQTDMRQLVDHMGEIDQPWNCPHGRPTMRHLVNLNLIQDM